MTDQSTILSEKPIPSYDAEFGSCTKLVCTDTVAVDNYDPADLTKISGKFTATYANGNVVDFQACLVPVLTHGVIPFYDDIGEKFLLTNRNLIASLAQHAATLDKPRLGEMELPDDKESDNIIEMLKVPSPYDVLDYDPMEMWTKIWYRAGLLVRMVDGRLVIDSEVPIAFSKYRFAKCNYYGDEDSLSVGARKVENATASAVHVFANDDEFADNGHGDAVSAKCLSNSGNGIPYVPSNPMNHSARLEITYGDGFKITSSVAFCDVLLCGAMREEATGALVGDRRVLAAVAELAATCRTLNASDNLALPSAEEADKALERYRVPDVPLEYSCVERAYNEWVDTWERNGLVVRIGNEDDAQYVVRRGEHEEVTSETPRQTVERLLSDASV